MSYILKALKRAENDRSKDNPKNFEDILSDEWLQGSQIQKITLDGRFF